MSTISTRGPLETTPVARVAVACDAACRLFSDGAALVQHAPNPFAAGIAAHAETTSIVWNSQYFMYYRTFVSPVDGRTCDIPQGIAIARSGDGGNTWTPENGGRPLPALQTVQQNQSCAFDDSVSSTWVYAPDVIADGGRLVMVFEQRVHDPNWFGTGRGRSLHSIRYVTSTDGRAWSTSTQLLTPGAVRAWDDEVGTPDIEKDGSSYVLTFHGHDSSGALEQTRGVVRMNALTQNFSGTRSKITLSPLPAWANYGVGMADMVREPDGHWYMIFEAFSGASGACGRSDTRTAVGIARSIDTKNWTVRSAPLITGRDGLSCGWDMPAWQNIGNIRSIVTPDDPQEGGRSLVRWNIVDKTAPTAASGPSEIRPNTYLAQNSTLSSADGASRLVMQLDGNLVLYRPTDGFVIWASDTNGSGATRAYLQYDGNLVLQRSDGSVVQATATEGRPGARLLVLRDRIQLDAYGTSVWQRPSPSRGM